MIGKLKGVVDSYGDDFVLLDVHGVCYQVHCPSRVLQQLPRVGEAAVLAIETMVREDMIKLFGFSEDNEREWFRILMTVQGVGAKVALGILGIMRLLKWRTRLRWATRPRSRGRRVLASALLNVS